MNIPSWIPDRLLRLFGIAPAPKVPHLHDDPVRTTPRGMARYADEYLQAAFDADHGLGHEEGFEVFAPMPVLHLTAHAIELALKAFLRHRGASLTALRLRYGHDLMKAYHRAVREGLLAHVQFDAGEIDALRVLNDLHFSRQLEYIVTGEKEMPIFGPISGFADKLVRAVAAEVGFNQVRLRGLVH